MTEKTTRDDALDGVIAALGDAGISFVLIDAFPESGDDDETEGDE